MLDFACPLHCSVPKARVENGIIIPGNMLWPSVQIRKARTPSFLHSSSVLAPSCEEDACFHFASVTAITVPDEAEELIQTAIADHILINLQ